VSVGTLCGRAQYRSRQFALGEGEGWGNDNCFSDWNVDQTAHGEAVVMAGICLQGECSSRFQRFALKWNEYVPHPPTLMMEAAHSCETAPVCRNTRHDLQPS
jgi:hypothetical protein